MIVILFDTKSLRLIPFLVKIVVIVLIVPTCSIIINLNNITEFKMEMYLIIDIQDNPELFVCISCLVLPIYTLQMFIDIYFVPYPFEYTQMFYMLLVVLAVILLIWRIPYILPVLLLNLAITTFLGIYFYEDTSHQTFCCWFLGLMSVMIGILCCISYQTSSSMQTEVNNLNLNVYMKPKSRKNIKCKKENNY
jgi:hypothetical protein